jgi:glucose/arabinose dehydrogenase
MRQSLDFHQTMNRVVAGIVAGFIALNPAGAQTKPGGKPRPTATKWDQSDVGPFFSGGLEIPLGQRERLRPALKSISIKLDGTNAAMSFDTERLRMAAGWTGGFLNLPKMREGMEGVPQPVGTLAFASALAPGWASPSGSFTEPKPPVKEGNEMVSYGPLPRDWAKWRGLYVHGDRTVLSYSVGPASVLELPGFDAKNSIFTRSFQIEGAKSPLTMLVCEEAQAVGSLADGVAVLTKDDRCVAVGVSGGNGRLETTSEGRVLLKLPAGAASSFRVSLWAGAKSELARVQGLLTAKATIPDLKVLTKGGPTRFGAPISTKGTLGTESGPYVVDTITLPDDNPWKSWLRTSGFDFFKDATRAALCTVNGEVWVVSGLNDKLDNLKWQRFATGMFQPLGLKIVDDAVYVRGRDQITRLHDLNGDGEADFYENFNNDVAISSHYHEFVLDLQTDSQGNFYSAKGGNLGPARHQHHGTLMRVSKDGAKAEIVCTGLRAPNGLSVGPRDEITVSDNEGNWVPSSRVNLVKTGGFYGHVFTSHTAAPPTDYDKPLFWLPHSYDVDNSSGGQTWVTSDKWGPFKGNLLHLSYGGSALFMVMREEVDGQSQAGIWKFPLKFQTGVMRGHFSPADGQLYICGLVVWQSNGGKTGGFQRVRYTGKPVDQPKEMHVKPNGVEITFAAPLDKASAVDDQNYSVEQWNYRWTTNYGSKEYSVENPEEIKHDPLTIKSIKLSADNKTVFLEIPGLKPVMQMQIKMGLKGADGVEFNQTIWNTINKVAMESSKSKAQSSK